MNVFLNIPVPAAVGVSAAVDTSALGRFRTVAVTGTFVGQLVVEISNDGGNTFAPLIGFNTPHKRTIEVAAQFMRVRVTSINAGQGVPFAPAVSVSANDNGTLVIPLIVPGPGQTGPAVDVSALGSFNTFVVGGAPRGQTTIQTSDDGVDWTDCVLFAAVGQTSRVVIAQFMRVVVDRFATPPVSVSVGATNDVQPDTETVKVTGNDAVADFLSAKVAAGPGVAVAVQNPGLNEQLLVTATTGAACFVYAPGSGSVGPVVFDDFIALEAAKEARRAAQGGGCFEVIVSDEFDAAPSIPAGGAYNFKETVLSGIRNPFGPLGQVVLTISEGATFTELYELHNIDCRNAATIVVPCQIAAGIARIRLVDASMTSNAGALPFWGTSLHAPGFAFFLFLENVSLIARTNATAVIDLAAGIDGIIFVGPLSDFGRGGLSSAVGTTAFFDLYGSSASLGAQPAALGTVNVAVSATPRLQFDPDVGIAPSVATHALSAGTFNRYNVAGGPVAQVLPTLPLASRDIRSRFFVFRETSGVNGLSIAPAVGNTLNGNAPPFAIQVPPGGAVMLITDGASEWHVLAGAVMAGGGLFGANYLSAHNPNRLTTTGAGFVTHTQLVTPALTGTYLVRGTALVDSVATMRCRFQNVTDGVQIPSGPNAEITPGAASDRIPVAWEGEVVFAGASKTIELQFSDDPPPGSTSGMTAGQITLRRVG